MIGRDQPRGVVRRIHDHPAGWKVARLQAGSSTRPCPSGRPHRAVRERTNAASRQCPGNADVTSVEEARAAGPRLWRQGVEQSCPVDQTPRSRRRSDGTLLRPDAKHKTRWMDKPACALTRNWKASPKSVKCPRRATVGNAGPHGANQREMGRLRGRRSWTITSASFLRRTSAVLASVWGRMGDRCSDSSEENPTQERTSRDYE
jgi:hypothetical protein